MIKFDYLKIRHVKLQIYLLPLYVITIGIQSCSQQSTFKKLQGHWHMDEPYSLTLDIEDSVVILNKYSLIDYPEEFPLLDSVDHAISLPVPCGCGGSTLPVMRKFQLRRDTLIYDEKISEECYAFTPIKFAKNNPSQCRWKHAITGRNPILNFTSFPKVTSTMVINLDSLRSVSPIASILVGFPIEKEQFGVNPKIQAYDVFIEPKEIPLFIEQQKNMYGEDMPLSVCLVIDNSVPQTFIDEVINAIPTEKVSNIFRLVSFEDENKFGYERMKM